MQNGNCLLQIKAVLVSIFLGREEVDLLLSALIIECINLREKLNDLLLLGSSLGLHFFQLMLQLLNLVRPVASTTYRVSPGDRNVLRTHLAGIKLYVILDQELFTPLEISLQVEYLLPQLGYLGRVGIPINFWSIFNISSTACIFKCV